jgi:hypothetical protein
VRLAGALLALAAAAIGCSKAQAIELAPLPAQIFTGRPISLPVATLKDAAGKPLESPPEVRWTIEPNSVAGIEGGRIVAHADGLATLIAETRSPPLRAMAPLRARIADAFTVACQPACGVHVGERVKAEFVVSSDGERFVEPCDFGLDGAAFERRGDGEYQAVSPGTATLDCGPARAQLRAAQPIDRLELRCPSELGAPKRATRCVVPDESLVNLVVSATAQGAPTTPLGLSWSSSDREVIAVVDGRLEAHQPGKTRITASADGVSAELEVQVAPAGRLRCAGIRYPVRHAFHFELGRGQRFLAALLCESEKSLSCLESRAAAEPHPSGAHAQAIFDDCCCRVDENPSADMNAPPPRKRRRR